MINTTIISEIDKKIKDKYHLFKDNHSKEGDQKIYDKVYDLCFDEMIQFLEENQTEDQNQLLQTQMEDITKQDIGQDQKGSLILDLIFKKMQNIENYRFRLQSRLEYFIQCLPK